jgi:uncharacterized protein with ParB-like and HNH nuclease domain
VRTRAFGQGVSAGCVCIEGLDVVAKLKVCIIRGQTKMKASETRVDKFLASNETTFAIPVYQRNYDWTRHQCQQLLNDILSIGADDGQTSHFIGSIVYVHDDVYSASGLTELTIIDGQQRLTTLTLLYCAIYRFALSIGDTNLSVKIHRTFLINEFAPEKEKLKLKPTENNEEALSNVLEPRGVQKNIGYSRIFENYQIFESQINQTNLPIILKGLSKLIFVDVALDRQRDNPQRIFESLNSTGLELSQADLIRNYILMGLPRSEQEDLYKRCWEPIELNARNQNLNENKVSDFIRDYLTLKTKDIPNKSAVYQKFKSTFPEQKSVELHAALDEMQLLSGVYSCLLNPELETDADIAKEISYVNMLEVNVSFPFLMRVYLDYREAKTTKDEFLDIMRLIQSFVWRRFIVGLPTNALNKIFKTLYEHVDLDDYVASVEAYLMQRAGGQRFPRNTEVLANLSERDIYNTKPKTRHYFFGKLENHNNNEHVDVLSPKITIEHIFPQNPEFSWKQALSSEEYAQLHEKYLNTVGNLTLSGNNGKLGNKAFKDKRDMNVDGLEQGYRFSRLWLNRDLKALESWNVSEVLNRIDIIGIRFLEIWEIPEVDEKNQIENGELNIFDAGEPRFKKLEYAIFLGRKIYMTHVAKLYSEVLSQLVDLQPEAFQDTRLADRLQITNNASSLREPFQLAANLFIEGNIDSTTKFERLKIVLSDLDIEDELLIKFADGS